MKNREKIVQKHSFGIKRAFYQQENEIKRHYRTLSRKANIFKGKTHNFMGISF